MGELVTMTPVTSRKSRRAAPPVTTNAALLDVNAAAVRLGVSVRFVRRLVHQRRIPFVRLGKLIRFEPDALDEWIRAQRVDPVAAVSAR